MLFLEIDKINFLKSINANGYYDFKNNDLYIPISIDYISSNIKDEYKLKNLPIYYLIEGMFFALGADKDFKFNEDYKFLLNNIKDSIACVKKIISDKVKENNLEDAFILTRGLSQIIKEKDVHQKLLSLGEAIRSLDNNFIDVQQEEIKVAIDLFENESFPYLYLAILSEAIGENAKAFWSINEYINNGGEKNEFIDEFYCNLQDQINYEKGKELLIKSPEEALKKLLPLIEREQDNALLYYHIGVAYRKLGNHEKAIYYLNESLNLDSAYVETVNEIGINYACVGYYEEAIKYFRKAFEVTKDIEICTNLIMCYINVNDVQNAKLHVKIAEGINKDDEVLMQLKRILEGE